MLQMISFGAILNHFGHKFEHKAAHGLYFERTLHSKWLSMRNGFGITPKGPMGPSPQRAPKAPLAPFVGPWAPWVPWVPGPEALRAGEPEKTRNDIMALRVRCVAT